MAKILFGGGPADFTVSQATVDTTAGVLVLASNVPLIAFNGGDSGADQVTDLAVYNGSWTTPGAAAPAGVFTSGANGTFLVWAEDSLDFLFVATQADPATRWIMHPVNIQFRLKSLVSSIAAEVSAAVDALVGIAGGIAGLDDSGKVPVAQLPTGTSSSTVLRGDQQLGYEHLPPGTNVTQIWDGTGSMPNRVTSRTDIIVIWRSPVEPTYGTGKAIAGTDEWRNTAP
ncbi:MAG TPA: hypothetical protein VIQ11_13020 [Mycobacterium sp.]